jgi:hypothetical protein
MRLILQLVPWEYERLEGLRPLYPQVDALTELRGIALYIATVVIGELGDVK